MGKALPFQAYLLLGIKSLHALSYSIFKTRFRDQYYTHPFPDKEIEVQTSLTTSPKFLGFSVTRDFNSGPSNALLLNAVSTGEGLGALLPRAAADPRPRRQVTSAHTQS